MKNVVRKANALLFVTILFSGMLNLTGILHLFPSAVKASPDWLSGWNCRRQLTVNGTLIGEALTDFPVLVKLDSSFFDFEKAKSSGEDVRFTGSDGTTLLRYEIEKWNSAGGGAYLWVKIPLVASGSATAFYMYYGNPAASDAQDRTNVWNANFKMVQHLKETSGTHADSTSNANNGSPFNGVVQGTTGKIDGADSFDGTNDYVDCGNGSSLTQTEFTIEAWVKRNGNGVATSTGTGGMTAAEPLIAKGRGYSETIGLNVNYFLGVNQGNKTFGFDFEDNINGLNHPICGATTVTDGQWYYVVATHNGTSALYVNGALDASNLTARTPDYNPWSVSLSTAISGAGAGTPAGYFNGIVDEVRISNKTFSAAWTKASYHSGNNSLLSYGSEESIAPVYSSIGYTSTHAGTDSEFHIKWSDPAGLDTAIFSTNNTGTLQNYSIPVSGTESWANKTVTLNDTPGTVVGYRWYCNNSLGYLTDTGMRTLTTSGDWLYAMKLYFNNTGVSETLVDFPVFINLSRAGSDFWSHVSSTVDDLRFVSYDSVTNLYFEVEYWNYSAHIAYVWVKVPQIDANSSTNFVYLYYGNPSPPASPYRDSTQVWTDRYRMVQHLEEGSGVQYDSTSYHNDAATAGTVDRTAPGFIDGADTFNGANGNYLNCGSGSGLTVTQYTIEALIKRNGNGVATNTGTGGFYGEPIVAKGRAYVETLGLNINYFLSINQTGNVVGFDFEDNVNGGNHPVFSNSAIQNGQWYYIALTYDGTANIYINGNLDKSTLIGFTPDYNPWAAAIGSAIAGAGSGTADGAFNGTIDEVRISYAVRSQEWVEAQNLSMNDRYVTFGAEQAPNTAPGKPFNPFPQNNAVGIPVSAELSVNVSDPDGEAMDVYFYEPGVEAPPPENFTVVALPDTQIYSSAYPGVFTNQTLWAVDNQTRNNIKFVTHEGDIIDTLTTASEWENANTSMSKLDGKLPYGFSPGNHDGAGTDTSTYNTYFGYSRYSAEAWYGGAYYNDNNNSYQLFSAGGDSYLVLHLQYDPSTEVLAWANSTLSDHSDRRVIVTTHEFLDASGTRTTIGNNIWNNFIFHHADQIFLVLCGHYSREARRTDTVNGHNVYQLLADYQGDTNGGNGWLRLIEFHPAEDKIYVKTYSPYLNSFETDSSSQFTLDYDMSYTGSPGPQLIGVAYSVPSGSRATVSWSGLNYSTTYNWYAVAVDSQGAPTQSDTWSFTTTSGHDIAIVDMSLSKSLVGQGQSVNVTVTVENQGIYGETFNLTAYANESLIGTVENVYVANGSSTGQSVIWNTAGYAEGHYTMSANVTLLPDESDASDNAYTDGVVELDTTPPSVNLLSPLNATYASTSVSLSFSVSEPTSWMGYSLDGSSNVTIGENVTLTDLIDGAHYVVVYANDTAGNMGASDTVYFAVDTTAPTITIISPENKTYYSRSLDLNYTTEEADWVAYSLDDGSNVTLTGNTSLIGLSVGPHILTLYANDTFGNTGSSAVEFTVANNPPSQPAVDITPDLAYTTDDLVCAITSPSTDADGDPITYYYEWYKNDILQPLLNTDTIPASETIKGEAWKCVVTPFDGIDNGTSAYDQVTILNSQPSIDSFSPISDPTILEGETQIFSITKSDADGDAIAVTWWLNNSDTGETGDSYTFTADYASAGTYNITVLLSDGQSEISKQWTLTVTDVQIGTHDIAVTNVTTSKDGCRPMPTVPDNSFVKINVTVLNAGNFTEDVTITVYANATVADTQTFLGLSPGTQVILELTWNATGWGHGNYTISAYATPVPSEVDVADNTLNDGIIKIVIPGDINGDGTVDIYDAILLAGAYNTMPRSPNWSPNADLKADDVIDIYDAIILANHYNQHE